MRYMVIGDAHYYDGKYFIDPRQIPRTMLLNESGASSSMKSLLMAYTIAYVEKRRPVWGDLAQRSARGPVIFDLMNKFCNDPYVNVFIDGRGFYKLRVGFII